MLEVGILSSDERIELLEGRIVVMPPCAPPHAHAIQILTTRLVRAAGDDLAVRVQLPLTLKGDYCPSCGSATLVHIAGCKKCQECGYSEC